MNPSLKALGLTLVVMFALSAVVSSTASAAPKLTPVPEEYPMTLRGSQVLATVLNLEGTRPTECSEATIETTVQNKAEAETSRLTAKPGYSNCTTTILGNHDEATITMNGCDFQLKFTETTSGGPALEGWEVTGKEFEIQCPTSAQIEIHVYASFIKHDQNEPLCTYKIAAQTVGGDLDYKLLEKNAEGVGTFAELSETLTGIAVTRTSGTLTNCGAASQKGTIKGSVKVGVHLPSTLTGHAKWDME